MEYLTASACDSETEERRKVFVRVYGRVENVFDFSELKKILVEHEDAEEEVLVSEIPYVDAMGRMEELPEL
jgi:uncharacterized protein YcaQ